MSPSIGSLPDGARGFDANQRITPGVANAFAAHGYQFAVRYVRRSTPHSFDLTSQEIVTLLDAGLGVMIVQHVAADGWIPTAEKGSNYGTIAATEARASGMPVGVSLWCDLEGVQPGVPADDVIAYCNNWHSQVLDAGYRPGLYVGWHAGLNAVQLYRKLKFDSYWSGYNLDADNYPARRGVQMRQFAAKASDRPAGVGTAFDVDVIHTDALGGTPSLLLPE